MKKTLCLLLLFIYIVSPLCSQSFILTQEGMTSNDNTQFIILDISNKSSKEIASFIKTGISTFNTSKFLKLEEPDENTLIVTDFIPGFTKTDKTAGSAYLLDLSYTIIINIKDGRARINVPVFNIAANQSYNNHSVITNKGVQFTIVMGIKGKPDLWNSTEKKMFIYNDKGKLIEETTKEKLETLFNNYISQIVKINSSDSDW